MHHRADGEAVYDLSFYPDNSPDEVRAFLKEKGMEETKHHPKEENQFQIV
jgi:hypothetical protein